MTLRKNRQKWMRRVRLANKGVRFRLEKTHAHGTYILRKDQRLGPCMCNGERITDGKPPVIRR